VVRQVVLVLHQRVLAVRDGGKVSRSLVTRRTAGMARRPQQTPIHLAQPSPDGPFPVSLEAATHSSASFLIPSHSLMFFCRAPFWVSHLRGTRGERGAGGETEAEPTAAWAHGL
jgi:hypothetical protein